MTAAVSQWSRRYVLFGALSLICWQAITVVSAPRDTLVALGVFGFVFHVVFGKAYTLIPAYFDTELRVDAAPAIQFPLVALGTVCLAIDPLVSANPLESLVPGAPIGTVDLGAVGGGLWLLGVIVFVGTLGSTVYGPLRRGETGTGEHNADRLPVDTVANAFVPFVLGYLLVGSYETAALRIDPLPTLIGVGAAATHLLVAGAATLLVLALGFRMLPRFFGGTPSRATVVIVLSSGAMAPALLAIGFVSWRARVGGAILMALAMFVFAVSIGRTCLAAPRRRVGTYAVLAGASFGVVGVALGVDLAFGSLSIALTETHLRFMVLGFLGLVIVGVSFHLYPPRAGVFPGSSSRVAVGVIAAFIVGLAVELVGALVRGPLSATGFVDPFVWVGQVLTLIAAIGYGYLVASAFSAREN